MEYGKFVTKSLVSTGKIECRSLEKGFHKFKAICLLYLSVSTAAVIGQFGGPYSTVQLKFKAAKIYGPHALCLGYKSKGKKLGL